MKIKFVISLSILVLLISLLSFYLVKRKQYISNVINYRFTDITNVCLMPFYYEKGEYPKDILDVDQYPIGERDYNTFIYINKFWMKDEFSSDKSPFVYYPLYDRVNKRRVSFILVSAGIDGKLQNQRAYNDTLFLDSWWHEMKLYNFPQVIQYKYYNDARATFVENEWEKAPREYGISYEGYENIFPRFSLKDNLFGKRDLLLQIDSLPF